MKKSRRERIADVDAYERQSDLSRVQLTGESTLASHVSAAIVIQAKRSPWTAPINGSESETVGPVGPID